VIAGGSQLVLVQASSSAAHIAHYKPCTHHVQRQKKGAPLSVECLAAAALLPGRAPRPAPPRPHGPWPWRMPYPYGTMTMDHGMTTTPHSAPPPAASVRQRRLGPWPFAPFGNLHACSLALHPKKPSSQIGASATCSSVVGDAAGQEGGEVGLEARGV
jgi:hypothetical protein